MVREFSELVAQCVELLIDLVLGYGRILDLNLEVGEVREGFKNGPERHENVDFDGAIRVVIPDR